MDIVTCLVKTSAAAAAASAAAAAPAPASTPESVSTTDLQVVRSVALSRAYFDKPLATQDEFLWLRQNYRAACELVYGASKFMYGLRNQNHDIVHGRISPSALSRSLSHMFPLSFEGVFFTSLDPARASTGVISESFHGAAVRFSRQQKNTFETYLRGAVLVDNTVSGRGSGTEESPWIARLHMTPPSTTAGIVPGMLLMASGGSGSGGSVYGGSPTSARVTHVDHANNIVTYSVVGGTAPVAGQVTDIHIGRGLATQPFNSFSVIQNIAGNKAKAVLDTHGSYRKVIDFSEVCIVDALPFDLAKPVEWFALTEHNSSFSFKSQTLFSGLKFCCFKTSVPSYNVTKVDSTLVENNLFTIEIEISKNQFLSSWDVFSTQCQAGYLLWSPNYVNSRVLDIDIDSRLSSLSPVGIRSGCQWNKVFDVQQLSASLYEMITGGKAPFSPTPKNVRRWIQEEESLLENLKLHPYKQFDKGPSAVASRYTQGTISRSVSPGKWENMDYHGIRFHVHYKLPILNYEKVANVENKWKLFYNHYDCDTVIPSTHPQTRVQTQVSFENYALAGNAQVERFSLLETGTGIDPDGRHYFTIFSYDSSPFSNSPFYVYLHSLVLLQCSLPRKESSEKNNPSGFYFLDNCGPKSVFSFEMNRLACQRRMAIVGFTNVGSGTEESPWIARLHMTPPSTTAGIVPGMLLMASGGSGSGGSVYGGSPTSARVTHVDHANSVVTYSVVGGTAPVAGQVTGPFTVPESDLNQEWEVRYSHSNLKLFERYYLRCNLDASSLDFVDSNKVIVVLKMHLLQSLRSFLNTSQPAVILNPTQHLPLFLCEMNRLACQRRMATVGFTNVGSGTEESPWIARLHMTPPSTTAGIVPGMLLMASGGSGSGGSVYGGSPTSARVTHVDHANNIVTYSVVGGTAPVAGQVTGPFTVPESDLNQEWEVYLGDCEFSPLSFRYCNRTEAISFSAKQALDLNLSPNGSHFQVVEVFLKQTRPAWHPAHRISFPPATAPYMILPHSGHSQQSLLALLPLGVAQNLKQTAKIQIVNFPYNMQSERSVGQVKPVSGSGTEARLHMTSPSTTAGIVPGMVLDMVYGGSPTSARVTHVDHANSIVTYSVVGGTAPVAGQVTDIGFIVNLDKEHTLNVHEISSASADSLFSRSIPAVRCKVLGNDIKTEKPLDEKWLLRYRVASRELSALVHSPPHASNFCDILELRLRKCIMKSSVGAAAAAAGAAVWGQLETRKISTNSAFRHELTTNADLRQQFQQLGLQGLESESDLANICNTLQFAESLWALLKAGLEGSLSMVQFRDGLRDVLDANVVSAPQLAAGIPANVAAPVARSPFSAQASLAGAAAALFGVWSTAKAGVSLVTSSVAASVPGSFNFRHVARHVVPVAQAVWALFVLREVVDGQGSSEWMVALLLGTAALILANFLL